jgi:hypothetical protein
MIPTTIAQLANNDDGKDGITGASTTQQQQNYV